MKKEIEKKFLIKENLFYKNIIDLSNNIFIKIPIIKNIVIFIIKYFSLFNNKSFIIFKNYIFQYYLLNEVDKVLRFRNEKKINLLTLKINSELSTISIKSIEFDQKLNKKFSKELIDFIKKNYNNYIEKTRYIIIYKRNTLEVDFFDGNNKGLIICEIENKNFNKIMLPPWIDKDITGDIKYFNSYLQKKPYKYWNN
ncbi:MAG: hypothetical protein N3A58_03215 [Spirochaetes bacterium]|nr:hypothetical protein [Spirochaetota bacterium]